ncbi:hypothetical protein ACFQH3_08575 [Haladaptatus sp. GCM10025707]|uniref:hypothetical protein n=1 Tax=unclassified Haladaptatus TaxID=2622732 RepID=UPI0023E80271|nr:MULTISPECIES: hypothetical protein [unclassified Haladaptatus]
MPSSNRREFLGIGCSAMVTLTGCLNQRTDSSTYSVFLVISNESDTDETISVSLADLSGESTPEPLVNREFTVEAGGSRNETLFEYRSGVFEITVSLGGKETVQKAHVGTQHLDIEVRIDTDRNLSTELTQH